MPMTNSGANAVADILTGGTTNRFNNANARIGVGDATTAFLVSQTDLQATTNKLRKAMEAGYPTVSGAVMTFRSRFEAADANFSWQEWAIFNAGTGGDMLLREVEDLGLKASDQVWQMTVTVVVTPGA